MKNYRIKKITSGSLSQYFCQRRFLGFWFDMFVMEPYSDGSFPSFEKAREILCTYLERDRVEYIDVDCKNCNN